MMRHARPILIAVLLLWPTSQAFALEKPDPQLDCRVFAKRSGTVTLGFKAGNFLFSVGPEVTLGLHSGIDWERTVQGLIARYVEVCNRYNAGMVTKAEYEKRLAQIEGYYKEAHELEQKLVAAARDHARQGQDELAKELGGKPGSPAVQPPAQDTPLDQAVTQFANRLDQQDPIGRPLSTSPPCPVQDLLGPPARSC